MPITDPDEFARQWMSAWNARDLEAVLSHFHDDATFNSPIARAMGHGDGGTVRGKTAIRKYWTAALEGNPHLRFTIDAIHKGADALVITFRTQDDIRRAEVLIFQDDLVIAGYGTATVPIG